MHDLLTQLLQANLAAAAAIAVVLILRRGVRVAFGAQIAYALWLLVPLAAAASLAPPRPAELLPAPPAAAGSIVQAAEETAAQLWTWGVEQAAPAGLDPLLIIFGLWLAGAVLMIAWLVWEHSQFMSLLTRGQAGPAVVGFFRPRIVTPSDFEERFDHREQTVVLAHEKIHLARHDTRINVLVALARCLCWFNPLIHVATRAMRVDQELACDAAVVKRHPKARAPYAQALLKAQLAVRPLPLGCYWPAGTQHPLMERIAMLKQSNPSLVRRLSGAALICVLSAGAGYAAWAAAPAAAPAIAAPLTYIEEALSPAAEPETLPEILVEPDPAPQAQAAPPQIDPLDLRPDGRPYYGQAFARRYDGNDPVTVTGVVVRVDWLNPNAALWVYGRGRGSTGADLGDQLWRVDGGASQTLSPEARDAGAQMAGTEVNVRGYFTKDKSCDPTCRLNGRDVLFPNGEKLFAGLPGKPTCTFEEVRDYICPGSDKVSPIPVPPTEAEIALALAKGGKDPRAILDRSFTTNAVRRKE